MAEKHLAWRLDDIVALGDFDALYAQIKRDITTNQKWYKSLKPDMTAEDFRKYTRFSIESYNRMSRLSDRVGLMEAEDSSSEVAKQLKSRVTDLMIEAAEYSRKVGLWWQGVELEGKQRLDDVNAKRLFAVVSEFEYVMQYGRAGAKHSLDAEKESIITNKDANGLSLLVDLRELVVSDQAYTLKLPNGKTKVYETEDEVRTLFYDIDPFVRKAAYRAILSQYKENIAKYFVIYQGIVKDWGYEAKLRHYSSPIGMRNYFNHVPDRAIEVLMEVCEANVGVFHDFFRYKAKLLGVTKLNRYDVYAPIKQTEKKYGLDEAIDVVITTFNEFSPQFASHARKILDDKHVDTRPAKNRRGGAFCATVNSEISPYVFLNYTSTARDVSTLAHELGHGVHSLYASQLPTQVQHATLPLAETASTFGEMLLFERLLADTKSPNQRKSMLLSKINDSYATICRQNFFVRAEIEAHNRMGEGLTPTLMGEIWFETLKSQFGTSVEVDPIFAYEWAAIPHIVHTPFYCYAYNFGELLSLALYARYKQEGKSFVPKIEAILSAGGSQNPEKILKNVGIDMRDEKFWQGSFVIIKDWMRELKNI